MAENQENTENLEVEATDRVEVSCAVTKEEIKKIEKVCYEHAKDTYKKGDRIDWFVMICGIFALGCLGVSIYNVIRYQAIDWVFIVMMVAYVLVAAFCLIKPLQYALTRMTWKSGFAGRLVVSKSGKSAGFAEDEVYFSTKKKDYTVKYADMWDGYTTDEFYIFHYADGCIIPVSKANVTAAEQEFEGEDLKAYFEELVEKAHGEETKPESAETTENDEKA